MLPAINIANTPQANFIFFLCFLLNIFISYLSLFIKENVSLLLINSSFALPTNSAPQNISGKKMRGDYPNRIKISYKNKETQSILLTKQLKKGIRII